MGRMTSQSPQARANLERALQELDKREARIGWFSSAKYPDGTPVAYVASIQENGAASRSIPPRPMFAPTIAEQMAKWKALIGSGVKAIANGAQTAESVLDAVGLQAAGDVRETIATIQSPPLSAATLAARDRAGNSSTKPLVDTRYMSVTLTSVVVNK